MPDTIPVSGTPASPLWKPWWQSRGIVGAAVALVAAIVTGVTGLAVSAEQMDTISEAIVAIFTIVQGIGCIVSIVGRFRAKARIEGS
jgi:membrane protein YdbS with pleckstrin-like domain